MSCSDIFCIMKTLSVIPGPALVLKQRVPQNGRKLVGPYDPLIINLGLARTLPCDKYQVLPLDFRYGVCGED